jgi:hypothetical protein
MSQNSYANNPSNPAAQPFNIGGQRCKSKKNSWWNAASPNYFRNKGTKKSKQAFTQEEATE